MSELIPIWNSATLTGATTPPPFTIPNNPNAQTLKINNQSRYWLLLSKTQTSVDVDRIEPFSFVIMPFQSDLSLKIDMSGDQASSLSPDKEFVDYSTIDGTIAYMKGSTQFVGSSTVTIGGDVNIGNSELNVAIQGAPTFNLAAGNSIAITGTPTMNIGTMPSVTFAAGSSVSITGTPTMNIGTMPAVTFAAGSKVEISGSPTMNIGTMPNVTIANASLTVALSSTNGGNTVNLASGSTVAISGTPTFNVGTMPAVTFAAGSSVSITGNPTMNIGTMPSVTIGNATLNVKFDQTGGNNAVTISGTPSVTISNSSLNVSLTGTNTVNLASGTSVAITGTPTMNIGTMPNVTIANASLTVALSSTNGGNTVNLASGSTVAISGTPTMNIGTMPSVTFAAGSSVSITGTPTMNIGTMPSVTFAAGSSVSITGTPTMNIGTMPNVTFAAGSTVSISGTPTMNINSMPNVTIASGTVNVSSATIDNSTLPSTFLYNGYTSVTYPTGVTQSTFTIPFLPQGEMIEFHKANFYIKSAQGKTYTGYSVGAKAQFADGTILNNPKGSIYGLGSFNNGWFYLDINDTMVANIFTLQINISTALTTADTLTIYWQIDANDTAIETPDGYGVAVMPCSDTLSDFSGTIITANTSQQIIGSSTSKLKYILFQNLSSTPMYLNIGATAGTGAGNIYVAPNGGSIIWESGFVPSGQAYNVYCSTAGAAFTFKIAS